MTDVSQNGADPTVPLPSTVAVSQAFNTRLPTQRVLDALAAVAPGMSLSDLVQDRISQLTAFRALLRDFPLRDTASLWAHAYDVEVEILDVDPTNGQGPTPSPRSAASGDASPETSTA